MNESEKLLRQMAMDKIARMDKRLEEKEIRDWQEALDYMKKRVARDRFNGLVNINSQEIPRLP